MLQELYDQFLGSTGICTDTRKLKEGQIFFALKGPNFNGNKYAQKALADGACLAVVDEEEWAGLNCLLADDVLQTLQDLAHHHRMQFDIPVLAITGSNGKTTTKELLHTALSTHFNTLATIGNLNNHIGVPLTLLALKSTHEFAIVEMGANHIGEIAELAEIAAPTCGLITNIGTAHIEGFGSFEGVLKGKTELYNFLKASRGLIFVNAVDDLLRSQVSMSDNYITYSHGGELRAIESLGADPFLSYHYANETHQTQLVGAYNFPNVAAAIGVANYFRLDEVKVVQAINSYLPGNMRSQLIVKNNRRIVLDAYNANPTSMKAALQNLSEMKANRKAVILGDMGELGESSERQHASIVDLCLELRLDGVILCGKEFSKVAIGQSFVNRFETRLELEIALSHDLLANDFDLILIKASRSMGLEKVVELL